MRRIANDPEAGNFDMGKPPGLYVFAPDNTQLQQAFARVASEILRIFAVTSILRARESAVGPSISIRSTEVVR